jgi:hypothetical protein
MTVHAPSSAVSAFARVALGITATALSVTVDAAPRTELVHCGTNTCMRVSGHRAHAAVTIRIAGRAIAAEGGTSWRATLPLAIARTAVSANGGQLLLTLIDARAGTETVEAVTVPPGSLGKHIELSALTVRPH